jgi:hypothetical protein
MLSKRQLHCGLERFMQYPVVKLMNDAALLVWLLSLGRLKCDE